jgi:hypothetical protein
MNWKKIFNIKMSTKYEFSNLPEYQSGNGSGANRLSQLDSEFDQHLADMKKYILNLKERKCE